MAANPDPKAAFTAFTRFGYGARPGDLEKAAGDPRGFLKAEMNRPDAALISLDRPENSELMGSTPCIQATFAAEAQRKIERERKAGDAKRMAAAPGAAMGGEMMGGTPPPPGMQASNMNDAAKPAAKPGQPVAALPAGPAAKPVQIEMPVEQKIFRAEMRAAVQQIADADSGFVERLVRFWSNHFCVSVAKGFIERSVAGSFEREAVRPFVLGRFADMLAAVERHPAMLFYLDNQQSIGPNSRAGQNRKRGLNENLAREILELHTLGVGGGYTQSDVTSLARVITGWTFVGREGRLGEPGTFVFNANAHEPGDHIVLAKTYAQGGMGQGEAALNDLARHPSTAKHIAFKLARHFVADDPPPALVERLAKIFKDRDGDLRAMAAALVDAPEAWVSPLTKMRSPFDFVMAARRAVTRQPMTEPGPTFGALNLMGQPMWQPPGPNGFPDIAAAWASAEGMKVRLDIAAQIARQTKEVENPSELLDSVIGEACSPETKEAVARAESREQGLALLLMSPEFQRR